MPRWRTHQPLVVNALVSTLPRPCSLASNCTCCVQVMKLRDELELKVDVLSLPVDICVQHALQGKSALQGALNVALRVLQDIEDYEANLRQQEIDMVRNEVLMGHTHLL